MRARVLAAAALAALLTATPSLDASAVPAPSTSASAAAKPAAPEDVPPDSPRASVRRFEELCQAGEWAEAATYLDIPDARKAEGPTLARHLYAVLDRPLWGKIDTVSANPAGDPKDGLPSRVDQIATVVGSNGPEPVRIIQRAAPDGVRWIFSRRTVEHIDDLYAHLKGRWQDEWLPAFLLRHGPKGLVVWQWVALPVLFAASSAVGWLLALASRVALSRIFGDAKLRLDRPFFVRLGPPLQVIWAVTGVDHVYPLLIDYAAAKDFLGELTRAGYFLGVMWFFTRATDIVGARILSHPDAKNNPAALSLVPLATKSLKVILTIGAVLAGLSELGVAVGSLVTGLGIGGVALALAAQKTVENLFGSLSIGVDQPFRVGDYVTVDGISGTVESIGLRSTRIRTPDRTLVTFPNGKLADMRVESYAPRDRIRFSCVLTLDRSSSAEQVQRVVEEAREFLAKHEKVWPDPWVSFSKVSDASLDVEIVAWFTTTAHAEFLVLREEALLGLLAIVNKAGTKLAPPPG